MPTLTKEKRNRLRLHAEQIISTRHTTKQYHWTQIQAFDYAVWMLEVLNELDRIERILKRKVKIEFKELQMLKDMKDERGWR
jgi:CRISPR/Cas system-associated protein Cas7 (RAMP superfamily)